MELPTNMVQLWLLTILILCFPVSGFAGKVEIGSDYAIAKGANPSVIYQKYCSVCHGENGDADTRAAGSLNPRPRNFTTEQAALELTRERMIHSVTYGRPGTAMVAHGSKLTRHEIESLVDYMRRTFMHVSGSSLLASHEKGAKIYKKNCSACHGDQGNVALWAKSELKPPPRNFTSAESKIELTRDRMINSVTNGRPGTAMMPFSSKLSKKEIGMVVDYVRAAFMKKDDGHEEDHSTSLNQNIHIEQPKIENKTGVHGNLQDIHGATKEISGIPGVDSNTIVVSMSLPMPKGLKGDFEKGRHFFMNNCFTCHGVNGDGTGPRSHFITPPPRNFTNEYSHRTYNRPRLFNAITNGKRGTVMPAWGKVLTDQEIANVAEFVFQAFIQRSDKTEDVKGEKSLKSDMAKKKTS